MKKKIVIISIIIIIILIIGVIIGYFVYKNIKKDTQETETTGTKWGDTYCEILKSNTKKKTIYNEDGTTEEVDYFENVTNAIITFIKIEENSEMPTMFVSYEKNGHKYLQEYYNDTTSFYPSNDSEENSDYELELLYNIEKEKYIWYVDKTDETGNETFISYENQTGERETYSFTQEEMETNQTDEDGTKTLSKFEQTFIEVKDAEYEKIEIENIHNIDEGKLEEKMTEAVNQFKETDEIITDEIKTETETKKEEIEEQIKLAEEQVAKEAEEKAQELAEKEAYVGTYTNGYGNSLTIKLNDNNELVCEVYNQKYVIDLNKEYTDGSIIIYEETTNDGMYFAKRLYPVGVSLSAFSDSMQQEATDSSKIRIFTVGTSVASIKSDI